MIEEIQREKLLIFKKSDIEITKSIYSDIWCTASGRARIQK